MDYGWSMNERKAKQLQPTSLKLDGIYVFGRLTMPSSAWSIFDANYCVYFMIWDETLMFTLYSDLLARDAIKLLELCI